MQVSSSKSENTQVENSQTVTVTEVNSQKESHFATLRLYRVPVITHSSLPRPGTAPRKPEPYRSTTGSASATGATRTVTRAVAVTRNGVYPYNPLAG